MEFKIGDKIRFKRKLSNCGILKAKTGQIGTIVNIEELDKIIRFGNRYSKIAITVELSNKTLVEVLGEENVERCLEHYKKQAKVTLKTMENEALLEKFVDLISLENRSDNISTKRYLKVLEDIETYKKELLERLDK